MRHKQLFVHSVYYTIGEILPRVIGFLLLPILTRYLTPAEYGINSYTNTVMLFSFAFSTLSLNTFLLRNYYKESGEEARKMIVGSVFVLTLCTNTIVTGIELLLFPWLISRLGIQVPFYPFFLLAILNNFLEGFSVIPLVVYRIRKNAGGFVALNTSRTFLQFALTFLLLTQLHYGLIGVYLARLLVNIPYALLFVAIIYRGSVFRRNWSQLRKGLTFSLPLLPGALSFLFISTFDRIVLEKNVGLTSLGLYSTAATFALTLNVVIQGLYRTFEQRLFESHDQPDYHQIVDSLYRYFIGCLLMGGFLLSIYSKEVFLFFTSRKFLPAYAMIPLLSVSVILSGLGTFLGTLLIADHLQKVVTKGTIISALITLIATVLLTKYMGTYGAILASILSFVAMYATYLYHLRISSHLVGQTALLLGFLLVISVAFQRMDMTLGYALLLKTAASLMYGWFCISVLRLKPSFGRHRGTKPLL